jgi:hypothetical protein
MTFVSIHDIMSKMGIVDSSSHVHQKAKVSILYLGYYARQRPRNTVGIKYMINERLFGFRFLFHRLQNNIKLPTERKVSHCVNNMIRTAIAQRCVPCLPKKL